MKLLLWNDFDKKSFIAFLYATLTAFGLPFLPYCWARLSGAIPDGITQESVGNHGPWAFSTEFVLLFYICLATLLFFLPGVSVLYGIVSSVVTRQLYPLLRMIFLVALQWGFAYLLAFQLWWLVD